MGNEVEVMMFSEENDMIPGPIPECLEQLTNIEESSIKMIKPCLNVYRRKGGSYGFSGHCISFAQDVNEFATVLPWPVSDLPIILLKSDKHKNKREFAASASKIRKALLWLKENHPDYKDIEISEENLSQYKDDKLLEGITTIDDGDIELHQKEEDVNTHDNLRSAIDEDEFLSKDMPRVNGLVPEGIEREEIDKCVKKALNEHLKDKDKKSTIEYPTTESEPEKEYMPGFFRKAFPRLFPDGKGDITVPRLGNNPSMLKWVQHLLRCNRNFAKDPLFVMIVTNLMQKKQALQLSELYADKQTSMATVKDLREKLESGDKSALNSLFCFGKDIRGTPQFFGQHMCKSVSFLRDIRIESDDTKMFNLFLTFSAADNHWEQLHKLLPGSEKYLGKKIVKSLKDIPADANKDEYMTKREDDILRFKAVQENIDIVNAYFQKRMDMLWEHVLKPIFGGKHYIMRFEMQNRGTIHCHMVITVENGMTIEELDNASKNIPKDFEEFKEQVNGEFSVELKELVATDLSDDEKSKLVKERKDEINKCMLKLIKLNSELFGVTGVNPETDSVEWPDPFGLNVYEPPTHACRECFTDKESKEELYEFYTNLINRVMLHRCKPGYCKDPKKTETVITIDKDGKKTKTKEMKCRFKFPKSLFGFKATVDKESKIMEKVEINPLADDDDKVKKILEVIEKDMLDPTA